MVSVYKKALTLMIDVDSIINIYIIVLYFVQIKIDIPDVINFGKFK